MSSKIKKEPKKLELDINVAKMGNSTFFVASSKFRGIAWKSGCRRLLLALIITAIIIVVVIVVESLLLIM